jgi:DNA-3-methyladenine glycosylase I
MNPIRCTWAQSGDAAMLAYHDTEWGVPQHDDIALFELLTLEGAQAGLSWRTILARRQAYRDAFHNFNFGRIMRMSDADLEAVLATSGVVRNRQKVFSVRNNALATMSVLAVHGTLGKYLWSFVSGHPVVNGWTEARQVPASTPLSDRMSKQLRKDGFAFVGSTICYAFMQATGMVNDHLTTCFCYRAR